MTYSPHNAWWKMKRFGKLSVVFLTGVICLFSSNHAVSDETDTGFGKARIEGEYKMNIPKGLENNVYQYLLDRYVNHKTDWLSPQLKIDTINENFIDTYYDAPGLTLYNKWSGLRIRKRYAENGGLTKQWIQIKVTAKPGTQNLLRYELKWPVRTKIIKSQMINLDGNEFFGHTNLQDKESILGNLMKLGIDNPFSIRRIIDIEQNRKRVYIRDSAGEIIITITLDDTKTKVFWHSISYPEIELEMNEKMYTEGDKGKRAWMESMNRKIYRDLQKAFPEIKQDQKPKYNKCIDLITADLPSFKWLIRLGII